LTDTIPQVGQDVFFLLLGLFLLVRLREFLGKSDVGGGKKEEKDCPIHFLRNKKNNHHFKVLILLIYFF
jgi:hypothetical protein